jgi:hypothetical protein
MKSKIGTMPNAYLKGYKYLLNYAAEICGEVTADNAGIIAHRFSLFLDKTPDFDGYNGESSRDKYFSALGEVYGMVLERSFGWKWCWLVFEEDHYDPKEGVKSVISPDHKYVVSPIALIRRDFSQKTDNAKLLYEKIKAGDLPKANPEDFFELAI